MAFSRRNCLGLFLGAAVSPLARTAPATSADWPGYRGAARDGVYRGGPILTAWPELGLKEMWRAKAGLGYAGIAVAGGMAFTLDQRRKRETVTAYALESGKVAWSDDWEAEFSSWLGGKGPRATPTWFDRRLYALGALGELRCYDAASGKAQWAKNVLADNGAKNVNWGVSASPLVYEDKVVVLPGGREGRSVVAYNRLNGEAVWRSLNDRQAYTSPMLVELAGRGQLLVVTAERAVGLDPDRGTLLWDYSWRTDHDVNSAQPVLVDGNRFVLSAGYGHGAALVEVSRQGDSFTARTVWQNKNLKNKFNSSVFVDGHVYGLDEGILTCIDAATGNRKWKGGRYGYGQVLAAGGHLIVTAEGGEVALLAAAPDGAREIAKFPALDGKTWNTPALAAGRLLVRNESEIACFQIGA